MSGLLFLTSEDFALNKGKSGNILTINIPGFSLVLFYSTKCKYCKDYIPVFKKLPGSVGGCKFGMINVSHNKRVVMMSRQSISKIEVVPYILLYINGKPYMSYKGPPNVKEISRFIVEVSKNIKKQQQNAPTKENNKVIRKKGAIPAYTIGNPLCGPDDNVCYLQFNLAYGEETRKR